MKNNKRLNIALAIVLAGVWGAILLQVIGGMAEQIPDLPIIERESVSHFNSKPFVYKSDVRDPFQYVQRSQKDSTKKRHDAPIWSPPPLKLTGVVLHKKKRTAMLEADNGSVYFLMEGETVEGVRVFRISDKAVSYSFNGRKSEWILE